MSVSTLTWAKGMVVLDRLRSVEESVGDSFAIDELLCKRVGEGESPVCHLWRHRRAFVMGTKDSRLPGAADGVRRLRDAGYEAVVRGSGGAAVPLDDGVVNVSLILPSSGELAHGFRDDFGRMVALIKLALLEHGLTVRYGEVEGSYCPGDYDLHIDGFKFCGISQRRQVKAMIVQAFVNVEGSGDERAALVRGFYARAGVGADPGEYPDVIAGRMTSLQERGFVGAGGTSLARNFADAVIGTLQASPAADSLLPDSAAVAEMRERLAARYPLPG
ncbi:MAG: lipoate--protein ligase family protein [Cohnella sp.]|nr:lipoate--protein ligase family protein [Cohnella sp.]